MSHPSPSTIGAWLAGPAAEPEQVAFVVVGPAAQQEEGGESRTRPARAVRGPRGEIEALLDERHRVWTIPPGAPLSLGRSSSSDIQLSHPSVSKLHAQLRLDGGTLLVADARSSNGTCVNGDEIAPGSDVVLASGDLVRLGACVLQVFAGEHFRRVLRSLAGA